MHPQIQWTETAGYEYGGVYRSPQAVLEKVFSKIPVDFESFSIDVERLIDGGNVVVMHSDGRIVRFDQYVESTTINANARAKGLLRERASALPVAHGAHRSRGRSRIGHAAPVQCRPARSRKVVGAIVQD